MASTDPRSRVGKTGAMFLLVFGLVTMLASQAGAGEKEKEKGGGKPAASESGNQGNGKGKGKPPGNNGTVKIDGVALGPGKGNEPHVGCEFAVEFYNYEEGNEEDFTATVTFALQAPTRRDDAKKDGQVLLTDKVFIGEDPAGGGDDLDASELYQLSFDGVEPHPIQGFHVKLTVNAPGSQGADVKHKVFWSKCETTPTTTPPTTTPTTAPPTTPTTTVTPLATPTTAPAVTTPTTAPPSVEPAAVTAPTTAPAQVLGVQETRPTTLARTGGEMEALVFLAGLSMALAGLMLLAANAGRGRLQVS